MWSSSVICSGSCHHFSPDGCLGAELRPHRRVMASHEISRSTGRCSTAPIAAAMRSNARACARCGRLPRATRRGPSASAWPSGARASAPPPAAAHLPAPIALHPFRRVVRAAVCRLEARWSARDPRDRRAAPSSRRRLGEVRQPALPRVEPLSAAVRAQPGQLVRVEQRGFRDGEEARASGSYSRSATRPATGAT